MKKIWTFLIILTILLTTGCIKRDKMEDIQIITTIYPIEFVATRLYAQSSTIKSIYPKGVKINQYRLTDKQINDFSKYDLFIYNGMSKEMEYATAMLNSNRSLKIIDASYGVDTTYSPDELWLNPSNLLMMAQNIRTALKQNISNPYVNDEVKNQYELLKVAITELETELKKTADNSLNKTIITYDETFKFIEKYGFTVINLTEEGKNKETNIDLAKSLFRNKKAVYLFVTENQSDNDLIKAFVSNYNTQKLVLRGLETITDEDKKNNDDYLSLMYYNIEQIKKETYR